MEVEAEENTTPKPKSFREALIAYKKSTGFYNPVLDDVSSDSNEDFEEQDEQVQEEINPLLPQIQLSKSTIQRIRNPWKDGLIVKLLGKSVGYKMLVNRVSELWAIQSGFKAIDLGFGFFLFKFDSLEDSVKVFTGGPWIVMDHYLAVRRWEPDFKPSAQGIKTVIWIRFPELPIEYHDEEVLFEIGKMIGKPLKIDSNRASMSRGKYARVFVEIDLHKPLVSSFKIGPFWYELEYESVHAICFGCGRLGHSKDTCRLEDSGFSRR